MVAPCYVLTCSLPPVGQTYRIYIVDTTGKYVHFCPPHTAASPATPAVNDYHGKPRNLHFADIKTELGARHKHHTRSPCRCALHAAVYFTMNHFDFYSLGSGHTPTALLCALKENMHCPLMSCYDTCFPSLAGVLLISESCVLVATALLAKRRDLNTSSKGRTGARTHGWCPGVPRATKAHCCLGVALPPVSTTRGVGMRSQAAVRTVVNCSGLPRVGQPPCLHPCDGHSCSPTSRGTVPTVQPPPRPSSRRRIVTTPGEHAPARPTEGRL